MRTTLCTFIILLGMLLVFGAKNSFCTAQSDTLRNEIGEIIPQAPPGQVGVDYKALEFLAKFKAGYLTLPPGMSEAPLTQCKVEPNLFSLLNSHKVYYVRQVFTGYQLGDTIRIIGSDTCYVPDLSQNYVLLQKKGSVVLDAVEDLYSHEATIYAEPSFIRTLYREPDDYHWPIQWNLKDINNGIKCPTAWNTTRGSPAVKLAIIDTGVNYDHVDLGGPDDPPPDWNDKIPGGYDYAEGDGDPMDYYGTNGHGSQCAGIAGALTNNNTSVAGISGGWNEGGDDIGVAIYALKVFMDDGDWASDEAAAAAIIRAADPEPYYDGYGCHILSASWGGPNYSDDIREAILFAYSVGASFVAAKGNAGEDGDSHPSYPADYDHSWVTAVASYGGNGLYCQAANCGYTSNYGGGIDITAPGWRIPSTNRHGWTDRFFSGTSAACPHVSGSIALARTLEDGLRNEDTEWIMKFSTFDPDDGDEWTWHERYGHGDLRVSTAIYRIQGPPGLQSLFDFYQHTATGGYSVGNTDFYDLRFNGPGEPTGEYRVKRYDVRVDVTYPEIFSGVPYVWGLGHNTIGWSAASPNYQVGYCRLYPGSQQSGGCQLQTFVYEVYDGEDFLGWFPCEPDEVSLQYKIWGVTLTIIDPKRDAEKILDEMIPQKVCITGNYPNPFNLSTSIEFGIPEDTQVSLSIYDLLGRKVNTLVNRKMSAGYHSVLWDGTNTEGIDIPSGIYFSILEAAGQAKTVKMTMLK